MAHGPVEILADGKLIVAGGNGPNELHVTDSASRLTIRAANLAKAAEPVPPFDLRRGIVPGAGITLGGRVRADRTGLTAPPRPEHARAAGGVSDDSASAEPAAIAAPFRSVVLFNREFPPVESEPLPIAGDQRPVIETTNDRPAGGTAPVPHPAPSHRGAAPATVPGTATVAVDDDVVVHGIVCSRDHFNNPTAAFCMVCGISMVHVTHNLVPGPRPTLGFVVFDDGSTFGLDRSYVIGREPGETGDLHTAPLTIQDNNETLSRRHAEIRLIDWTVHLVDLGSTNGTFIWDGTFERWTQIAAHQPVTLAPGATVALGRRTFVFESVTRT
jgi:pSer/pThr/pTyr-binding forkhead associated (FHA) protein